MDGSNILVLKEHDVKVITDLMMGGDGTNVEGELGDLHLSAISEAMNQMMGSSATSLSTMLGMVIDISPPDATLRDLNILGGGEEIADFLGGTFVKISFRMQIDDLVDSTLMQLYPIDFAKKLVDTFMGTQMPEPEPEPEPEPIPAPIPQSMPEMPQMAPQMDPQMQMGMPMGMPQVAPQMGMPMGMPQMAPQMGMPMGMPQMNPQMQNVNIQPAQFQNFSSGYSTYPGQENIGLISDVPLEVTVELGRTTKVISEILDFAPGTIIELDKIAGEPVDVLVNGKFVAKGEVVVIEESFGVRVTEIIK
ncbi:MAG: flagellar motor switch phosphatase FliY [Bacteroidaceae bacterium]|nr:flagellar motor switch phosphatase FliY [Bacteroidaceae bacterium]